jgi:hypothetical protein
MKKLTKYTDEPMKFKIVKDFLPQPEKLVFKNAKKLEPRKNIHEDNL